MYTNIDGIIPRKLDLINYLNERKTICIPSSNTCSSKTKNWTNEEQEEKFEDTLELRKDY